MDIVGRDAELEIVGRFLDDASEARALLLTGEAGIGKSTIWQAALSGRAGARLPRHRLAPDRGGGPPPVRRADRSVRRARR